MEKEKRIHVWVQRFKDRDTLVLQWLDPLTGKRKSKSADTADEQEAENLRSDLEADLNAGRHKDAARITWEAFRETFEREYASGNRENTQESYKATFDGFEKLCKPGLVKSITGRTISQFVGAMREEKLPGGRIGYKASSIKVRLQVLHTALTWAVAQGFLVAVPPFPRIKVPEKKPRPVPPEAFERMVERAQDLNMRVYLATAWLAGLRLSEAWALEWEETTQAPYLDLAGNRIILPAEMVKAATDQWVPLDPALKAMLLQLPRHGRKVFQFMASDGHEICVRAVSGRVIRLARHAGVRLTYHTLRKGFGCRYAGKVPAQVLQRLMRHANISITMGYYANVDDAVMAAVLGTQCNSQCNSGSQNTGHTQGAVDATSCDHTSSPQPSSVL